MQKKYSLLTFALAFLMAQVGSATTPSAPMKIGFVDYDQAIKEEKKAQEYVKDLEKQAAAVDIWEQEVKGKIEPKIKAFQESVPKLSEEKRKAEEAKLSDEINKVQQESVKRRQKLTTDQESKLHDLKTENAALVKTLATKGNFDMVLNAAAIVWVSDKVKKENDLTKQLVDEYNKKNPVTSKGVVKPPEGKKDAKPSKKE